MPGLSCLSALLALGCRPEKPTVEAPDPDVSTVEVPADDTADAGWTRPDGPPVMRVDGAPFFVIGYFEHEVYTRPEEYDADYAAYRSQGVNTVIHWGSNWGSGTEYNVMAADQALANGLKYISEIHHFAITEAEDYALEDLDRLVDALWDHEALIAWYLFDEPGVLAVAPERLREAYARVQARDRGAEDLPQLVVFSGHNEVDYFAAEPPRNHDVCMVDVYPVSEGSEEFSGPLHRVSTWTRFQRDLIIEHGDEKPQLNVTQACGVDGWSGFRLPTYDEQRYLAFGPVVMGARGVLWWDWGDTGSADYVRARGAYRRSTTGPVATQLAALSAAILSNEDRVSVSSNRSVDSTGNAIEDITWLVGSDDDAVYLIAVNNTPKPLEGITFTLEGAPLGGSAGAEPRPVTVLYEALLDDEAYAFSSRELTLQPGSGDAWTLTDDFDAPYDVNLYRISR